MSGYVGVLQRLCATGAGMLPGWLRGPNSAAFLESLGLTADTMIETLVVGLQQSRPMTCFEDALSLIGGNRGIKRYPNEPAASYRIRCASWRQIKRHAGSPYGGLINLQPYFLPYNKPVIRYVFQSGDGLTSTWHTLDASGIYSIQQSIPSNWNWDEQQVLWSRFWVIVYVNGVGIAPTTWDGGALWDGGAIWDGYLTANQIADIVAIINDSKAAYSMLAGVILATDPASFDPATLSLPVGDGTSTLPAGAWGMSIDPLTNIPTRLATAIYAYDYALGP